MFTIVDSTTSRSLDGRWELRQEGDTLEIWRRIDPDLFRRVDTLHAPTIDQLQVAILRAGRVPATLPAFTPVVL